jgi:hypothetical protein
VGHPMALQISRILQVSPAFFFEGASDVLRAGHAYGAGAMATLVRGGGGAEEGYNTTAMLGRPNGGCTAVRSGINLAAPFLNRDRHWILRAPELWGYGLSHDCYWRDYRAMFAGRSTRPNPPSANSATTATFWRSQLGIKA